MRRALSKVAHIDETHNPQTWLCAKTYGIDQTAPRLQAPTRQKKKHYPARQANPAPHFTATILRIRSGHYLSGVLATYADESTVPKQVLCEHTIERRQAPQAERPPGG